MCACFCTVVIWGYFLRRALQKSTSPFSSLLEKHRPQVIKDLIRSKEHSRDPGLVLTRLSTISCGNTDNHLMPLRRSFPWASGDGTLQGLSWCPDHQVCPPYAVPHSLPWDAESPSQAPFHISPFHSSCSGKWLGQSPLWDQISFSMWGPCRSSQNVRSMCAKCGRGGAVSSSCSPSITFRIQVSCGGKRPGWPQGTVTAINTHRPALGTFPETSHAGEGVSLHLLWWFSRTVKRPPHLPPPLTSLMDSRS